MSKLADDETNLVPYDQLSRGKKQEMDLQRRKALKDAKTAQTDGAPSKAIDAYMRLNPVVSPKELAQHEADVQKRKDDLADRVKRAQKEADYGDTKRALFGDDVPHKVNKDAPLFDKYAKGGRVGGRGDGIAQRGKTRGRCI